MGIPICKQQPCARLSIINLSIVNLIQEKPNSGEEMSEYVGYVH